MTNDPIRVETKNAQHNSFQCYWPTSSGGGGGVVWLLDDQQQY